MTRLSILIALLVILKTATIAQPSGVDPFSDVVPYSVKYFNKSFLSNQDAATIKTFFENQPGKKPVRIIETEQGYHHGYRIYYSNANGNPSAPEPWIQIFTINTAACLVACEKNNPALLESPFLGFRISSGKSGRPEEEVDAVVKQYRHLATKYYRLSEDNNADLVSEMSLVFQKYNSKIKDQTGQMLASTEQGVILKPVNTREYSWNLWLQCFEEINQIGYNTLIEYSEVHVESLAAVYNWQ